jgi:hypothetical protein
MLMTLAHSRPKTFLALTLLVSVVGVFVGVVALHLYTDHVTHHQVVDLINGCLSRPDCKTMLLGAAK